MRKLKNMDSKKGSYCSEHWRQSQDTKQCFAKRLHFAARPAVQGNTWTKGIMDITVHFYGYPFAFMVVHDGTFNCDTIFQDAQWDPCGCDEKTCPAALHLARYCNQELGPGCPLGRGWERKLALRDHLKDEILKGCSSVVKAHLGSAE